MKSTPSRLLKFAVLAAFAGTLFGASGCATIVGKGTYPVQITSSPSGAQFSIKDRYGNTVHTGRTPSTVELKSCAGYFRGASYTVEFESGNIIPIRSSSNSWYFANIPLCMLGVGFIGMFVVDPLTGAMRKLPDAAETAYLDIDNPENSF